MCVPVGAARDYYTGYYTGYYTLITVCPHLACAGNGENSLHLYLCAWIVFLRYTVQFACMQSSYGGGGLTSACPLASVRKLAVAAFKICGLNR
jgi:hypothetical protein